MARVLLGTANGLCKEVFVLPVSDADVARREGRATMLLTDGSGSGSGPGASAPTLTQKDALALSGVDVMSQSGRTKFLREQQAFEAALAQQDRAQRPAWGAMAVGTEVVDMCVVPGVDRREESATVFSATVHEPHKKVGAEPIEDEEAAEKDVYTILESYACAQNTTESSMRRYGFRWADGGATCVARTGGPATTSVIADRLVAISPIELTKGKSGNSAAVLVSCSAAGTLRLHPTTAGSTPNVLSFGSVELGSVGERVAVIRCGHVYSNATATASSADVVTTFDVLVGGQEHDLEVWKVSVRLEKGQGWVLAAPLERTFKAKNLRDDHVKLRRKVWISDMRIVSQQLSADGKATYEVSAVTRYGQYRFWNTAIANYPEIVRESNLVDSELSAPLRKIPLFCAASDSVGALFQIDPKTGQVVAKYKNSSAGSVRRNGLAFAVGFVRSSKNSSGTEAIPLLLSAGLDRFLRAHHALTRNLLHRLFVKQHINCVLSLPVEVPPDMEAAARREEDARKQRQTKRDTWGDFDESDLLAGIRAAPKDVVARTKKGRKRPVEDDSGGEEGSDLGHSDGDDEDGDDGFGDEDDMEAAAALAVVEAQMNNVRKRAGKNESASRETTARRIREKKAARSKEIRDYNALSSKKGSSSSRDKKRQRRS